MNVFVSIVLASVAIFGRDSFSRNIYLDVLSQTFFIALALILIGLK